MSRALELADHAASLGDVPVGAVIVLDDQIIGEGWNTRENQRRPTGHAEIMAIESAALHLAAWRLLDTTMYVTLEPCFMCAGAIVNSRITRVVCAALDPKAGAMVSKGHVGTTPDLNHQVALSTGCLAEQSSRRLKDFFKARRAEIKKSKALS